MFCLFFQSGLKYVSHYVCLRQFNGWISLFASLPSDLPSCLVVQQWGSASSPPVRSRYRRWLWMGQRHTSPLCPCPRTCQSWLKELTSARGLTQRRMGSKANPGTVSGPSRSPRKKKVTYAQESAGDFFSSLSFRPDLWYRCGKYFSVLDLFGEDKLNPFFLTQAQWSFSRPFGPGIQYGTTCAVPWRRCVSSMMCSVWWRRRSTWP